MVSHKTKQNIYDVYFSQSCKKVSHKRKTFLSLLFENLQNWLFLKTWNFDGTTSSVPCVHPSLQHLHKLHPTIPQLLSSLPHYREGNHDEPTQKVSMFVHLTTEQFTTLLDRYQKLQANISAFLHHHTPLTSVCSFPSSSSNSSTLEMKLGDFYKNHQIWRHILFAHPTCVWW